MKSKLKEHLGDDIVITELHCERNVVTFCLTVVSVIFGDGDGDGDGGGGGDDDDCELYGSTYT